ncbi:MAG TPA: STAS domain-containing protein [Candidatus Eisenbacteria bacterium]|nr:STAS domain-containing protein [Candidatus Eisenbacteria bacterium]
MGLQIAIREIGDVSILDLRGRSTVDDGESELLSGRLKELVEGGVRNVLVNLADVTKIDSSGISVMVGTCVSLRKRGGDLKLLRPRGHVLEVLTVFRLLEVISRFENEAEAVASFGVRGKFATI